MLPIVVSLSDIRWYYYYSLQLWSHDGSGCGGRQRLHDGDRCRTAVVVRLGMVMIVGAITLAVGRRRLHDGGGCMSGGGFMGGLPWLQGSDGCSCRGSGCRDG